MIFPVSHADTATTSTMTTNSSNQLWYPVSDGRMRKICSIFLPPSPNHPHYPPLLCDVTPGFSAFFVALALVYFSFFIGRYFMIWLSISFKSAILALFIYLFTHTHIYKRQRRIENWRVFPLSPIPRRVISRFRLSSLQFIPSIHLKRNTINHDSQWLCRWIFFFCFSNTFLMRYYGGQYFTFSNLSVMMMMATTMTVYCLGVGDGQRWWLMNDSHSVD